MALNPKHEYFSIVCTFKEVLGHDIVFLDVLHGKDGYARSYIADQFSPQEYGVATTTGSGMSALCEELITGWLADGTIDSMIAEWGL